jgi:hypothetical protein
MKRVTTAESLWHLINQFDEKIGPADRVRSDHARAIRQYITACSVKCFFLDG